MTKKVKGGKKDLETESSKAKVESRLSQEQQFKMGVSWWSELFIFYGILTAIACWEIRRFNNMAKLKKKRISDLETSHDVVMGEIDKLEVRVAQNAKETKQALLRIKQI